MLGVWLAWVGCGPVIPDNPAVVENDILSGDFEGACTGFLSPEAALRTETAKSLAAHPESPIATKCTCDHLYDKAAHTWDAGAAEGLEGTKRDDLAVCLAAALDDDAIADKVLVVKWVAKTKAPKGLEALANTLKSGKNNAARAAAATGLTTSDPHVANLIAALKDDPAPEVRAAAGTALMHRKTPEVAMALAAAATSDPEAKVRAGAVKAIPNLGLPEGDAAACKALEDASPGVRAAAAVAMGPEKRPTLTKCLADRVRKGEPEAAVRSAILTSMAQQQTKDAKLLLCELIGPYTAMYIKDGLLPNDSPDDAAKHQNDIDWENSYACVEKAMRQPGLTCAGKFHLQAWYQKLGGSVTPRPCPGMQVDGTGEVVRPELPDAGGEISFE
jgi:hypothetical protein